MDLRPIGASGSGTLSILFREVHAPAWAVSSEADLHAALLRHLVRFITELGRDFCFVGSEYPVQVGKQDFAIGLLFFLSHCRGHGNRAA